MQSLVSQTVLYFFGPFFCYPWKPVINALSRGDYSTSYKNFRSGHSHSINIALHCICLVFQVLANFALLAEIDSYIVFKQPAILRMFENLEPGLVSYLLQHPFSFITLLSWVTVLGTATAPFVCTLLSLLLIVGAFYFAPKINQLQLESWIINIFSVVLIFGSLIVPPRPKAQQFYKIRNTIVGILCFLYPFFYNRMKILLEDKCAPFTTELTWGLGITMALLSFSPWVPQAPAYFGCFAFRFVGTVTSQPFILLWGFAFTAQFMQGIAHHMTGETPTLEKHNKVVNTPDVRAHKVALEWGHVTYFPTLSIHAVYEFLVGKQSDKVS